MDNNASLDKQTAGFNREDKDLYSRLSFIAANDKDTRVSATAGELRGLRRDRRLLQPLPLVEVLLLGARRRPLVRRPPIGVAGTEAIAGGAEALPGDLDRLGRERGGET